MAFKIATQIQADSADCRAGKRKACCFGPIVLVFIGLCIYFSISTFRTANSLDSLTVTQVRYFYDQSHLFVASNITSGLCKALNISSRADKKVLADFFLFASGRDVFSSTALITSKAIHTCRNTRYCRIPYSVAAKFVVITFNTTDPVEFARDLANHLECNVEKLYDYFLWGGLLVANFILFTIAYVCARRKIFPQF